jgi:uncharacterized protein
VSISADRVPLFLLNTVLFPKGVLRLRVFEKRYVDMVRTCMRENRPFGVCLITKPRDENTPTQHETIGCLASIVDFDMEKMGLLLIRGTGGQRFCVLSSQVEEDGLTTASISLIENDVSTVVPSQYSSCAALARELIAEIKRSVPGTGDQIIGLPYEFDSAAWVSNRLSEVLPISTTAKQQLMALEDPIARLKLVSQYLQDQKVLVGQ